MVVPRRAGRLDLPSGGAAWSRGHLGRRHERRGNPGSDRYRRNPPPNQVASTRRAPPAAPGPGHGVAARRRPATPALHVHCRVPRVQRDAGRFGRRQSPRRGSDHHLERVDHRPPCGGYQRGLCLHPDPPRIRHRLAAHAQGRPGRLRGLVPRRLVVRRGPGRRAPRSWHPDRWRTRGCPVLRPARGAALAEGAGGLDDAIRGGQGGRCQSGPDGLGGDLGRYGSARPDRLGALPPGRP